MRHMHLLLGISVFWLALSMLFDGVNTLVLPQHLLGFAEPASRATTLGLLTFVGLLLGMLVQPVAGLLSDHLRLRWGRRTMIALGVVLILASLVLFGIASSPAIVFVSYCGQQNRRPSLEAAARRVRAPLALPIRVGRRPLCRRLGRVHIAPEAGGVRMKKGTGTPGASGAPQDHPASDHRSRGSFRSMLYGRLASSVRWA